ncbi:MAG: AraC family transcriptional regulator [Cytophagales bacterium]|nr:AraC family transcriptional regulator [Cytophagales bacterium]
MDNNTLKEGFVGQKMIVLPKRVKKTLKANAITQPFHITDIGHYPKAKNHFRQRIKGASEYIFIYCTEGEGWFKLEGKVFKVLPNRFFIVPRKTEHSYAADKDNPWTIYWAHFNGTAAQNLFERYYSATQPVQAVPFENSRISLFHQIYKILENSYTTSQMEYAGILGLHFVGSFIFKNIRELSKNDNNGNLVDSIIAYLNQNLDKLLQSEDIAKKFNYSYSYIFTLFKKRTGYSLIHFFNLKKVQKACEFLNYTDLNIKEISYKVGFQDPLYFSRIFKKYMGISPKAYKEINRR